MIAIVDYGMGNLGSIENMLTRIGVKSVITSDPAIVRAADKLILPGVGAFDSAVENLDRLGILPILEEMVILEKKPILGICLGMQLFSRGSEEGNLPGLGWIAADTVRFHFDRQHAGLKIPHMGWNTVEVRQRGSLLDSLEEGARFYFVHSYHVRCDLESNIMATTTYGTAFASVIAKDNIVGTQFHPEKSHRFGLRLLHSFAQSGA